jgi:4'-phosphopantetheinyl transferase
MNRDGIADPRFSDAPEPPGCGEPHVWRVALPPGEGRGAARRALRVILGAYLGVGHEAIEPTVGERGKPALAASPTAISFNLSHSGELALVAVAAPDTEVGIDVERRRPRRDLVRLAERWLPEGDAEAVARAPEEERERAFYAAWTRFEARAKCTGAGLSGPAPGPDVTVLALDIDPGYAAALATSGSPPTVVHRFDFVRLDTGSHG